MNKVKARGTEILRLILVVGLLVGPSGAIRSQAQDQAPPATTQERTSPSASPQTNQNQNQEPKPADKSASPANPAQEPSKPATPDDKSGDKSDEKGDFKITPRQAEELFHSVDEILEFDSKQTGLPIKHEVKRKLTSRDEVVSYLTKHVND